MNRDQILASPSMPLASPSYPRGPYRFVNREYFIVTYETDPQAIRDALPEPLEPDGSNTVLYEFIRMPDSSGFGDYTESGIVIPARFRGEPVNFTAQMYLDCDPPIAGGREIWGFPKKLASPNNHIRQLDASQQTRVIATTLTTCLARQDSLEVTSKPLISSLLRTIAMLEIPRIA